MEEPKDVIPLPTAYKPINAWEAHDIEQIEKNRRDPAQIEQRIRRSALREAWGYPPDPAIEELEGLRLLRNAE